MRMHNKWHGPNASQSPSFIVRINQVATKVVLNQKKTNARWATLSKFNELGAVAPTSPGTKQDKGSADAWQQGNQLFLLPTLLAKFQVSQWGQLLSTQTLD